MDRYLYLNCERPLPKPLTPLMTCARCKERRKWKHYCLL
jgi:hypothetical protein